MLIRSAHFIITSRLKCTVYVLSARIYFIYNVYNVQGGLINTVVQTNPTNRLVIGSDNHSQLRGLQGKRLHILHNVKRILC